MKKPIECMSFTNRAFSPLYEDNTFNLVMIDHCPVECPSYAPSYAPATQEVCVGGYSIIYGGILCYLGMCGPKGLTVFELF